MAQRIVKLCLIRGFTEAYYQLAEEERKQVFAKIGEVLDTLGVKMVGPYYNCRWSNDKYGTFFLLEYPDIDAAISDTANCEALNLFRYLVSETILGIPQDEPAPTQA